MINKAGLIHPYYYPTTVVVVDDNMDFLVNFSLQLDENIAFRLFSSATDALTHVNTSLEYSVQPDNCLQSKMDFVGDSAVYFITLTVWERA